MEFSSISHLGCLFILMLDPKIEIERILLLDLKNGDVLIDPLGEHGEIVFTGYVRWLGACCITYETRNRDGWRTGNGSMMLKATVKMQRATDVQWPEVRSAMR